MTRAWSLRSWIVVFPVVLAACGSSHGAGLDAGGGDAALAGDAGRVACGATLCEEGLECCNASCGICAPPGTGCPAIACVDAGSPTVCGFGTCAPGALCCEGCAGAVFCAAGPVCPELDCPPGCSPEGAGCDPSSYCEYASGCGGAGVGTCLPRPTMCPRDCPGVCGCDGVDYCNPCTAAAMGVDVARPGSCAAPPPPCAPMDARSEGSCEMLAGYAWNGSSCVALVCSCAGMDCDRIYASPDACMAEHAGCAAGASCGGFAGDVCAPDQFCDYAPGDMCGATDGTGLCRPRPTACPDIDAPVCGCDGTTYGNECEAHAAGVDVLSRGECGTTTTDCRATGCAPGSTCTACAVGEWICLPEGTVCAF